MAKADSVYGALELHEVNPERVIAHVRLVRLNPRLEVVELGKREGAGAGLRAWCLGIGA